MPWITDEDGKTVCPNCGKHYWPELEPKQIGDRRPIQQIYPKAKAYQREQLLSGICSDKCWKEYLGGT